jgi:hypothetical protein
MKYTLCLPCPISGNLYNYIVSVRHGKPVFGTKGVTNTLITRFEYPDMDPRNPDGTAS